MQEKLIKLLVEEGLVSQSVLYKAQSEGVAIISAFNDLKNYYNEPNLITFGDHVEGCRHISKSEEMSRYLPEVSNHFMAAETTTGDRLSTMDSIRESGNNILHQHSVAKEGINIPNLHSGLIGRMMNIIGIQQAIGRSDRALYIDTLNFEKGLITLDSPEGWVKPYNIIYLVVDSDETFAQRLKDIVRYLLDQGIPEDQWDITAIDDEGKGGSEPKKTNSDVSVAYQVDFDSENFKKMIEQVKIEIQNEEEQAKIDLEELREKERLNSMPKKQLLLEKLKNTTF
jgi:hypothetical protein